MKIAVLTVSTSVAAGSTEDRSGRALAEHAADAGGELIAQEVVPDDQAQIEAWLRGQIAHGAQVILTTGGTGFTPDDVTPEATLAVIDRHAPGYAEAMRSEAVRHTPMGILTRGVSGIAGRTLIINFPGNPKAIDELFPVIAPTLEHAVTTLYRERGQRTPPAIELAGLTRYFGERTALRDVTLSVPAGATLAVLGRNGAGKSTLLRMLATLLRPHAGEIAVLGEALPRRGWAVRGRIGLLGHEPLLYRDLTGRENLRYHARLHRVAETRIDAVLEATGMTDRDDEPVRQLSRGMVQRLAIARAVLHEPELLLLDEPRANLDPGASEQVEPLIGRPSGRTRVLTSHDPRAALAEADLVLALKGGRPVYAGDPAGFDDARLQELYA